MTGALIKLLDIYTTNLGNIFSQVSVWIFLCTLISVYSNSAIRAAVNEFGFCMGMLLTYYITAEMTASVYSLTFVYGWTIFALFSPLMGFCVWYSKGKSWVSRDNLYWNYYSNACGFNRTVLIKSEYPDILFAVLTGFILFKN